MKKSCKDCWFYIEKRESFDKKSNEFVQTHYCDHPLKDGNRVGLLEKLEACSQFKERQKTAGFNLRQYGAMTIAGVCAFLAGFPVPGDFGGLLFLGGGILSALGGLMVAEAAHKKGGKE